MKAEKKSVLAAWITLLVMHVSMPTFSQQWIPNFKHYTTADGLPSSEIYQLTSDNKNNLWFVTDRGVVRFDGYSFRVFDNKDSLPENSTLKLYKDFKGRIWFISYTGLLSHIENEKIIPYQYNHIIRKKLESTIIVSMFTDPTETVHLNTISGDICKIDGSGNFIEEKSQSETNTYIITQDNSGRTAVNYTSGKKKPMTQFKVKTATKVFNFTIKELISYSHFGVTSLANGDILFYCNQFLIRIHPSGGYELKKLENPILNVFEDSQQNIWIGSLHNGVQVYDSDMTIVSHYLTDISVTHIYNDYEGGLWLSSLENGIYYISSRNGLNLSIGEKLLNKKINSITGANDSLLFFSTSRGILYRYNFTSNEIGQSDLRKDLHSSIESVSSLYFFENKNHLVAGVIIDFQSTSSEMHVSKWKGTLLTAYSSLVRYSLSHDGSLLGSEYTDCYKLNASEKTVSFFPAQKKIRFTAIFEDARGQIFAGALDGLYYYKDNTFIPFRPDEKKFGSRITDINEIGKEYLVAATRSNGIIIFNDSLIQVINSASGLSSDNINRIKIEKNIIWAGTNKGLNKIIITDFSPLTFSIEQFNMTDGLASDEINDLRIGNRLVYLATNEGVTCLDKNRAKEREPDLTFYFNSIKINEKDTVIKDTYSLQSKQNTINISFTAVSFKNSKNIFYRYRLWGLDSIWRTTTNRDVQFTSLPYGSYEFQISAYKGDEKKLQKVNSIFFTISPPFYKTRWFLVLITIIIILLIILIIEIRIKNIRKKERQYSELNKQISELNLKALRSQMNPHFTFNVLNSIQYYVAKKDTDQALQFITKFSRLIRMILDQSRTLYISLDEEIKMLQLYVELEELRFENKFTYSIELENGIDAEKMSIPGMLIQPHVENAIKHGIQFKKGKAHIGIQFKVNNNCLICSVTDNGIGRKEAEKLRSLNKDHKPAGTSIINERMQALHVVSGIDLKSTVSDLVDENGSPAGTRVIIEIPFKYLPV